MINPRRVALRSAMTRSMGAEQLARITEHVDATIKTDAMNAEDVKDAPSTGMPSYPPFHSAPNPNVTNTNASYIPQKNINSCTTSPSGSYNLPNRTLKRKSARTHTFVNINAALVSADMHGEGFKEGSDSISSSVQRHQRANSMAVSWVAADSIDSFQQNNKRSSIRLDRQGGDCFDMSKVHHALPSGYSPPSQEDIGNHLHHGSMLQAQASVPNSGATSPLLRTSSKHGHSQSVSLQHPPLYGNATHSHRISHGAINELESRGSSGIGSSPTTLRSSRSTSRRSTGIPYINPYTGRPASPLDVAMPSPPRTPGMNLRIMVPPVQTQQGQANLYNTLPALESKHQYVLTGTLQQSLFGVVKLGWNRETYEQVAIKVSRKELTSSSTARSGVTVLENVRREASALRYLREHRQLQNPGILEEENRRKAFQITRDPLSDDSDSDIEMNAASVSPMSASNSNKGDANVVLSKYLERKGGEYVCRLIDEIEDEQFHYVITEFVPAGDLYSLLTSFEGHRMSEENVRPLFTQLLLAVHWLHSRRVAHCDLSLENVCLDRLHRVRLIDFGLAALHPSLIEITNTDYFAFPSACQVTAASLEATRLADREYTNSSPSIRSEEIPLGSSHTQSPRVLPGLPIPSLPKCNFLCQAIPEMKDKPGKVRYMSPELLSGHEWDAFSNDCFSLGVILYSLLTGRPPFQSASSSDVWFNVIYNGQWLTPAISSQPTAHVYSHLSANARDLINKLIKPQNVRLTTTEIFNHPFVQQNIANSLHLN